MKLDEDHCIIKDFQKIQHYSDRCQLKKQDVRCGKIIDQLKHLAKSSWTILSLHEDFKAVHCSKYAISLQNSAKTLGMIIDDPRLPFKFLNANCEHLHENISKFFKKMKEVGLALVIVILPKYPDVYRIINKVTKYEVGILILYVHAKDVTEIFEDTIVNLLLKIKSKLSSINHALVSSEKPCMQNPSFIFESVENFDMENSDVPTTDTVNISSLQKHMRYDENNCTTEEFYVSINKKLEKVSVKILNPPEIQYNSNRYRVNQGFWRPLKLYQTQHLKKSSWTILSLHNDFKAFQCDQFVAEFKKSAKTLGMIIDDPRLPFKFLNAKCEHLHKNISKFFKKMKEIGLVLVIVILPKYPDVYSIIKHVAELKVGILTQCVRAENLTINCKAIIENLLLKTNSKLNGVNHTLVSNEMPLCLQKSFLILGAYVTREKRNSSVPTIAAVTACYDVNAFKYEMKIKLQRPGTEVIESMGEIVSFYLNMYKNKHGTLPKRIIYYRDIVSNSQTTLIIQEEIAAIRREIKKFGYSGKIICIVAQKRIHVRVFPAKEKDSNKTFKIETGTVMVKKTTKSNDIDFYLWSQTFTQETAKPIRYRCICNDTNENENEIERLTYYLCHMCSRCTRSTKYPSPIFYAHLAAARAKVLINGASFDMENLCQEQERKLNIKYFNASMHFL